MNLSNIKITNNTEKERKLRKKILDRIKKQRKQEHTFRFLIKHVGRGINGLLKRVHSVDNNRNIVKTYTKKEEIEKNLIDYNRIHYGKVL